MLGVLKRRWKPKRAASGRRGVGTGRTGDSPVPTNEDNKQARVLPSPRQIHPVCEDKAQLIGYESKSVPPPPPPPHSLPLPPVPPPMPPTYPLTPNICVEGGRIEFIKTPPDVSTDQLPKQPPTPTPPPRLVQTATTQTGAELEQNELAKVSVLEARIQELERALELEQRNGQRERLALTRLQRQLARREVLQRDVDRERRLRLDTELRLRDSASEAERCRARLASLQREFTRMEETVRSMLQYKARSEQLKQEKNNLTVAYETRVLQFQNSITKLGQENETLRKQIRELEAAGAGEVQASLLERLHALENDNATLTRDAELQRRQYERCLDDVANQVVRALLSQKGLREEVAALQRRVKELESQNRALTSVLVQQLDPKHSEQAVTSVTPVSTPSSSGADLAGVWFPLQRPRSLNLQTHHHPHHHHHLHHQISAAIAPAAAAVVAAAAVASGGTLQQPTRQAASQLIVAASGGEGAAARKAEDEGGSESPESGNRDEGYSTMSSDVQASERDPVPPLAGLQEASDETDTTITTTTASTTATALVPAATPTATHHLLVVEDACDPDVLYIPLGRLALGIGNPRHSFPPSRDLLPYQHVMRSFSDSHLCLKLTAASPCTPSPCSLASTTSSSPSVLVLDVLADTAHPLRRTRATPSLAAAAAIADSDEDATTAVEGCWWDTDYVQHWLRLDDTRSAMQRQLEYDQSELEDWTMSLSSEDIAPCTSTTTTTPGGLGPVLELEEDECVWGPGAGFLGSLLQDDGCRVWPATGLASPGGSWSSNSEDCCHSLDCCLQTMGATSSKRSSAALSDDADSCSPAALMSGTTDFTRDFYRLVKFESTKSLASSSSRSLACGEGSGISEREQALQSVLHFIAEQQQYCASRAEQDLQLPDQLTKELDEEPEETEEDKTEHIHEMIEVSTVDQSYPENEVISQNTSNRKVAREETLNEQNRKQDPSSCIVEEEIKQISDEVKEEEEPEAEEEEEEEEEEEDDDDDDVDMAVAAALYPGLGGLRPRVGEVLVTVIEEDEEHAAAATTTSTVSSCSLEANRDMTESMTSTVSTPDTVVSRQANANVNGFHERTSSKDVIEELNRMIRKGEEGGSQEAMGAGMGPGASQAKLDLACCCPTGWVHVERDIDFTDPKARANLLDVMLASSGSSGGSTGSSGSGSSTGSNSSDSGDEPADYQHLHRLHRFRRQKKGNSAICQPVTQTL